MTTTTRRTPITADVIQHEIACTGVANFCQMPMAPRCACPCRCRMQLNTVPTCTVTSVPSPHPEETDPRRDGFYANDRQRGKLMADFVCRECAESETCAEGRVRRKRSNLKKLAAVLQ